MVSDEVSKLTTNPHATGEDVTTWKGRFSPKDGNNGRVNVCVKAIGKVHEVSFSPLLKQAFGQRASGIMWGGYIIGEIRPPKHLAVLWCHTRSPPDGDGVDARRRCDEIPARASGH